MLAALRAEGGPITTAVAASKEIEQAAQVLSEAEHELDLFIGNPKLLSLIGEEHGLLDRVVLSRADGRAKSGVALATRTQIVLRGNVLLGSGGSASSS